MTPTAEEAIKIIVQLPPLEHAKVREWIDEHNEFVENKDDEKFKLALKWIEENKEEYDGQWVVLDGDKLISHGFDGKKVYQEAKQKGIETPFLERVKAQELPFGGW